jgi:transcriptional regulator with XRE-family HTH domain
MSIGQNLKRLRKLAKLSQDGLALKAGISQQLISQLETGSNDTTKALPRLAQALGVAVGAIDPNYSIETETMDELTQIWEKLDAPRRGLLVKQARLLEETELSQGASTGSKATGEK